MGERWKEIIGWIGCGYIWGLGTACVMVASRNGEWFWTAALLLVACVATYRAATYRANPSTP